jgi:hypothetical protein
VQGADASSPNTPTDPEADSQAYSSADARAENVQVCGKLSRKCALGDGVFKGPGRTWHAHRLHMQISDSQLDCSEQVQGETNLQGASAQAGTAHRLSSELVL